MSDDLESFFGRVLTLINKTSLDAHSRDSSRNQTDNGHLVVKDRLITYRKKYIISCADNNVTSWLQFKLHENHHGRPVDILSALTHTFTHTRATCGLALAFSLLPSSECRRV